jgi:hypothetical protein
MVVDRERMRQLRAIRPKACKLSLRCVGEKIPVKLAANIMSMPR